MKKQISYLATHTFWRYQFHGLDDERLIHIIGAVFCQCFNWLVVVVVAAAGWIHLQFVVVRLESRDPIPGGVDE